MRNTARRVAQWLARWLVGGVVLSALCAGSMAEVSLLESQPAEGDVVRTTLLFVSLRFSRTVRVKSVVLRDEAGVAYELERQDGMVIVNEITLAPPDLPDGPYALDWTVVTLQGDATSGSFIFVVRTSD